MMRAWIRFYAELNDFLQPGLRGRSIECEFHVSPGVRDVIESYGVPHTEVDLVLVNGVSVGFEHRIGGGDRISVYPVFESIDIQPLLKVRPEPLRVTRFLLDTHLGRLAAYLRMAGFDARYDNHAADEALATEAARERRILLTRDRGLLKRRAVTHGYCVRETVPRLQLSEVLLRFDLASSVRPFTRCLVCNGGLREVDHSEVGDRVPEKIRRLFHQFAVCEYCDKVYWPGTHYQRMRRLLDDCLRGSNGPASDL